MRKFYLLLVAVLLSSIGSYAATWYSQGTGDPSVLANWNSLPGGGGTTPTSFKTPGDTWNMQTNMTSASPWSLSTTSTLNVNSVTWTLSWALTATTGDTVGNLNINGTSSLPNFGSSYFYVFGDFTFSGSSSMTGSYGQYIHLSNTSSTLASPQHCSITTSGTNSYIYVYTDAGTAVQLPVNNTLNGSSVYLYASGTLDCQNNSWGGNGYSYVNGTATLYTQSPLGLNGAFTNTGSTKSFNPGATYVFNGTAAQVTGSYLPVSFSTTGKLIINNAAGVGLSQTTNLANPIGGLTLMSGILYTGANNLFVPGNPGAVSGAGAGKYVCGTLLKAITGFTSINYEVGDSVDYAPMSLALNAPGNNGAIGVKVNKGPHPQVATSNMNPAAMINHYWTITTSGAAGPSLVTPTATYNAGDILGGSNSGFVTNEYVGSAWLPMVLTSTNTSAPYTSTPTSGIALSSLAGDYIFGASAASAVFTSVPTMNFGLIGTGMSSSSQVFNLSGITLTAASSVTITAPANFQVSSDNATWVSSYSLPYSGTAIPSTPVYVRFSPTTATAYTGTVTVTGGGLAATANLVSLTGTGATPCSGIPTVGTASITPAFGGTSTLFTLSLPGSTPAGSLTYQWQSSASATSGFTNIPGATTASYNFTGISNTTYYQALVTCPTYAAATSGTVQATFSMTASYVGTIGTYTVPAGVTSIRILASGAQGGNTTTGTAASGGLGAIMQGDFCVTPGQVLAYVVGGQGSTSSYSGGGGGGSFVWDNTTGTLLIAAGGGGGGGYNSTVGAGGGVNASTGINGTNGGGGAIYGGAGTAGNGGTTPASTQYAGGGAGWLSNGALPVITSPTCAMGLGQGGVRPLAGAWGGAAGGTSGYNGAGGFGGGGGSQGECSSGSGGGGGGYSGGAAGTTNGSSYFYGGGGGGSLNNGVNQVNSVGNTGFGSIVFSFPTTTSGGALPASLSFGSQLVGTPSAPQTTTFEGVLLTPGATITITSPTGFDISMDGGTTWLLSPVTTTYTASSCTTIPVAVRLSPTATISYSGNLTFSGAGLPSTINVPLSGMGIVACAGVPTAGTTTMTPTAGNSSTTFNMSVGGYSVAAGIVFQWQSSPDSATWSNIAGATNTSYSAPGITSTTYFRCNVTCTNSFISVATNFVTANFITGACIPVFSSNGCANNEGSAGSSTYPIILIGASGTSIVDPTSCVASGYIDETGTTYTATLNAGSSYSLRVGANPSGYNTSDQVWIDFNNDGIFSPSETVSGAVGGLFTTVTNSQTLTVPSTVSPGVYRMRIAANYTSTSPSISYPQYPAIPPCPSATTVYGDIRDYVVTVGPQQTCATPVNQPTGLTFTQPVLTTINGSFTASSPVADGYLVVMTTSSVAPTAPVNGTIYTAGAPALGGTIVSAGNSTSFSVAGVTPGTQYWFWVYAFSQYCAPGTVPMYKTTTPLTGAFTVPLCAMSGTKVVGPTGDYPTISAALTAIGQAGIAGPIALELQTSYTGEPSYPLTVGSYPCASATNTITIRPQGTMTVTGNYSGPMFSFNGARYITIDGRVGSTGTTKALTLMNNNVVGTAVQFINDASYINVKYTSLRAANSSTSTPPMGVVFFGTTTGTTGCAYNTIDNCDIMDATGGYPAMGVCSYGTSGKDNNNNTISNCNIANYFNSASADYGIYLGTGSTFFNIINNKFYQTAPRVYTGCSSSSAIYISNSIGNGFNISGNTIGYSSSAGTGIYSFTTSSCQSFRAMYLYLGSTVPTSIQGNTITNISLTASGTSATYAYLIYLSSGSFNIGDITPNVIGSATGTNAITVNNSTAASGSAPTIYGIYSFAGSPSVLTIKNNIFGGWTATAAPSYSGGIYGMYLASTAATTVTGNTIGSTTTANSFSTPTNTSTTQAIYGIYYSNSSATPFNPIISNNTIANFNNGSTYTSNYTYGIYYTGVANPTISGNSIYNLTGNATISGTSSQPSVGGIVYTGAGTPTIVQNTIYGLANANSSTATSTQVSGMYLTSAVNALIDRNRIYGLSNASTYSTITAPPTVNGITLYMPVTAVTVQNNMISLGNSQTTNTSFTGILGSGSSSYTLRAYYNSVNIEGTATAGTMNTASFNLGNYSATANTLTTVDVRNNLFTNSRSGGGSHYAIGNGIGSAASSSTYWTATASNYNILAATASTVGYWSGAKTFATWKTAGSGNNDPNSFSGLPSAVVTYSNSPTADLHINMGTTPNVIESHATPIAGVNYDYDDTVRPGPVLSVNGGGSFPDIGANEFDGRPMDNVPPTITISPVLVGCGATDRTLTATISDFGYVRNTVPLQPQVYFRKNSSPLWHQSAGALASGNTLNGVWSFTVSAAADTLAAGDTVRYFVVAQDTTGNVGASPSTGFAAANVNSVTTTPTTIDSFIVGRAMGDTTYIISASIPTANFTTITAAVNAYNTSCLMGPVTFVLADTSYPGEPAFPIVIKQNLGANATNTLTIQPASGVNVTVRGSLTAAAIFKLQNASYVTIDGLNTGGASLTLNNPNTGTNADIWLASTASTGPGCNHITLKNMTLYGGTNVSNCWNIIAAVDGVTTPSQTPGADNDNVTIQGNTFIRSAYGIFASGTAQVSAGGLDNWNVSNNTFGPAVSSTTDNITANGAWLSSHISPTVSNNTFRNIGSTTATASTVAIGVTLSSNATITQNTINGITTNSGLAAGIYFGNNMNGATVNQNTITNITTTTGQGAGIYSGTNWVTGTINQNTITNIITNITSSGTSATCGISIGAGCSGINITRNSINTIANTYGGGCAPAGHGIMVNTQANSNILIANNMISNIYGGGCGVSYPPSGIDLESNTGGIKVYANTVNLNSSFAGYVSGTSANSACLMVASGSVSNVDVRDNIFTNTYDNTSTTTDKNYAVYASAAASIFTAINNNAYYVAPGNPMGYIGGYDEATLSNMQAGFGGDANSMALQPLFVSPNDLHLLPLSANLPLVGAGVSLAPVTVDFDGTVRSATPVIGAHEIVIPACTSITAGTITQSTPVCGSGITTLTAGGATSGLGASYQWRSSPDGVTYTSISGATNPIYTPSSPITATTYYRMVATCGPISSSDSANKTVTLNPVAALVTGGYDVCVGGTLSLSDATTGGTWSSSSATVASVGSTGVVTGNATGNVTITYTAATGCMAFGPVTVNTTIPTFTATGSPSTLCANATSTLNISGGLSVNGYILTSVPFSPLSFTPSATYNSATTPSAGTNDNGYYTIPLPFNFSIYNTTYLGGSSNIYIGTNGYVSFTTGYTSTYVYSMPTTSFTTLISATGRDLYMPAGDLTPSIKWGIVGTAPNRKLVINWNCYDVGTVSLETVQLIMEEATGAAEIHVTNQNANQHTIGIQNSAGSLATAVPGHNSASTPIANQAWRFIPMAVSYAWSPSSFLSATTGTSVVASSVTATPSVTYTVSSSYRGCTSSNTVTLTVNPSPVAITGTASACTGGTNTLSDLTPSGTWTSSNTLIAGVGSGTGVVTAGSVGTATISYIAAGCAATTVFTTNVAPGATNTGTAMVCTGSTTTLANSGGAGTWTSGSPNATVTNAGVVTGQTAGTATISYVNGCGSTVTTIVTVLQTPAAITGTGTVCPGLATTLADVNTGGTWSSLSSNVSVGSANGAITGVTTGTALITYDLGNGCTAANTVVSVNVAPTAPNFSPSSSPTICLNRSTTLTASITPAVTGTTYAWSGISGAAGLSCTTCSVNTITPTAAGANTYSVVATAPSGCVASAVVTVNVNPLPPAITGSNVMCAGGSVGLSNTIGGGTWASSNTGTAVVVSTTGAVTGMNAGTSTITYNAPTGCFTTSVITVQAMPAAAPTNSAPICNGGTVTLTANPSGGATTYAWSGPGLLSTTVANPTATPTTTAVYSLTVTNGTAIPGCAPTNVYTTSVTVNSKPTAAPTNSGPICNGGVVTLTANPGGSTSAYSWSGPNLSSTTAANPTATPTTTSTYTLVSTSTGGASGCASTYTTSVTVNGLPTAASITPSATSLCPGGAVTFTAGATAGTGSVVGYNWSGPNGYTATSAANNVVFTPTTTAASGAYSVAVVYSASGCTSNPVATSPAVTVNALPTVASVTPSSLTPCTGSAFTLTSGATTGTGSLVSYNWSGPNSYSATTATPSAVLSPTTTAANGVYSLTVTYPNPGCTSSAATTAAITFANGPVLASASSNSPVCVGGTLTLTANTPSNVTSYSWSGPVAITSGGATANATVTPASLTGSGIYSVTVTNSATSCVNTYTTSVTVNQVPSVSGGITSNSPVCANNTLTLSSGTASNVTGYAWAGPVAVTNSATATGSVPSITPSGAGTYTLTVNNGVGSNCAATYTTAVTVPASSPVYSVTGGGVYCSGGSGVQVGLSNSTSGIQYQLYRGATAVGGTVTGTGTALTFGFQTAAGTYTVTGTNTATGCVAQMVSSAVVSISPPPSTYNVTGGGSYCAGGTGVSVNLSYSDVGASYQLYNGATPMGAAVIGTGTPITFGNQTAAGTYNVIANPGSACGLAMAGTATVNINPLPTSYTLTGGGTYCAGGAGVPIGLTFGSTGIQYTLYNGATAVTVVNGANTALSFGNEAAAGTYTVSATNLTTGCVGPMAGSVNVTINPAPTAYSVTGGGAYCSGGTGVAVGLSSSAVGVTYQLYNGSSVVGTGVAGTGSALAFGNQSAAGTYSVLATGGNGCITPMSGTATVNINSAPIAFSVTGGGNVCTGSAGAAVGLAGSALGVNYQLYNGSTVVTTVSGTGSAISFGTFTTAGTYSILATNPTTGCATNMSGTAIINVNSVPAAFAMTGSGGYCPGGSGVAVGLSGSASGVSYQLYLGSSTVGTAMIGTGFGLSFGNQTAAGTYTVLATNPASGCTSAMTGSASVSINSLPAVYSVTGGGNYCSGGTGVLLGQTGSAAGVSYQLYIGATPQGSAVLGTGSPLSFGLKTAAGTYSVIATNTSTNCSSMMTGSATVSINPLPAAYNVTGGGGYCTGGAGSVVGLGGSATGTTYQLYNGATAVGGPLSGTGAAISFGPQTTAGTYTVSATSGLSCTGSMTGSAVVSINTPPVTYAMTGGGAICSSGTGTAVGLANSANGVSYQLYNGATAVGSPVAGTGSAISFGNQTAAGTYTALATNTTTGCTAAMTGTAVVTVSASPGAFNVTGGGSYCSGGTGVSIGLSNSASGVNYQLYLGAATIGGSVAGTGSALTFPTSATAAGTYTVLATAGTCTTAQTGSAAVSINLLPATYSVVGGGTICSSDPGATIGLSGSQNGVSYQLYNGSSVSGASIAGNGTAISFPLQTAAGTYTVRATNAAGCVNGMGGATVVSVTPGPTAYAVTGGGNYCSGTGGVTIGLSNSSTDAMYYLYNGTSVVSTMIGTGSAFNFPGTYTATGTYTVQANNTCVGNMTGSATVSILPLPTAYNVTGGGGYCAGSTGVNIGLDGSTIGINYQLYEGGIISGAAIGGTGLPLDFGTRTAAGTYSVIAINPSTSCINPMNNATTVTINNLPTVFSVTGGGGYCSGSTGVIVGLSGSSAGDTYQLYNGSALVGGPMSGTGAAFNLGLETAVGTYSVRATTTATGCSTGMSGTPAVSISPLPTAFVVTGGGNTCAGGAGVNVGLNSSTVGVSYQLSVGGSAIGAPVMGTGSAISFGPQTTAGSYNVMATDMVAGCTNYMSGSVNVNISSAPTAYAVTGGGTMCAGGAGSNVYLASSDPGVYYQLYNGATAVGTSLVGSGSSLNFGLQAAAGNYTVMATDPSTGCSGAMSGVASNIINPSPVAFTVTGGGSYCAGTAGVYIALANSTGGVNYQLYNGATAIGSPVSGTGGAISFGAQTLTGTYMVQANNASTGCTSPMSNTVAVTVAAAPAAVSVTGGGHYCTGGTGVPVGLAASSSGTIYQLYNGAGPVGAAIAGTGGVISFGNQTGAGTYTVQATASGCSGAMAGSATVVMDTLPAVQTVTGSGTFCSGSGVIIGLGGSEPGVTYQVYNGGLAAGSPVIGTGAPITSGPLTGTGTYSVMATNAAGCSRVMPGVATIIVTPAPTAYAVTGGGGYCAGGSSAPCILGGSQVGVNYQLYRGSTAVGTMMPGTGGSLNFGPQAAAGVYTVQASNPSTGCIGNMSGSAIVTVNAVPAAYNVMSTGNSYCAGGAGINVLLSNSDAGVSYQLYNGSIPSGAPVTGSGSLLSFGPQTAAGTYVVVATGAGSCTANMTGSAAISIKPLPGLYTITGGGGYCSGTPGAMIGLSNSDTGVSYQLYHGTATVGAPVTGTGSAISFPPQATVGSYVIVASNATSGCQNTMSGSVAVSVNPLPAMQTVTGGGSYCAGGTGATISLTGSATGTSYQLYNGSSMVGSAIPGTGSAISFPPQTAAGVYTVLAVSNALCGRNMTGSATIVVNPGPTAYNVTGGGNYCVGSGTGLPVGVANSAVGFTYQLYNGALPVGSALAGTGSPLDFGILSASGTYTVRATDASTLCTSTMTDSAVINANAAPAGHSVTGGGSFCSGGTGVHVGLDGSNSGISYRLYNGATAVGSAMTGTGSALDFGTITGTGSYTVLATNTTSGCTSTMTGNADVLSVTAATPSVSISTVNGDTLCLGILTTFNATGVNGGTGATYQWQVNGVNVGFGGSTYTYLPTNGDVVSVQMNSSLACATPTSAINSIPVTVLVSQMPVAQLSVTPNDTVCVGTAVTLSVTPTYGGSAPAFTWKSGTGATLATGTTSYSYTPSNGDVVYVQMSSNYHCRLADNVESIHATMVIDSPTAPVVVVTGPSNFKDGETVTLTASVSNGGRNPEFQWYVKNAPIAGATTNVLTSSAFVDGDSVKCMVTKISSCAPISGSSSVVMRNTTGVSGVTLTNSDIRLLPNPNTGDFMIKGTVGSADDQEFVAEITDMLGQVIYKDNVSAHNGNINQHISLSNTLANGMYMLTLRSATESKVFHFVIGK